MSNENVNESIYGEVVSCLSAHDYYFKMHDRRFRTIIEASANSKTASGRLLDVGCWPGYLSLYFKKLGWQVDAIDLAPERIPEVDQAGVAILHHNLCEQRTLPYADAEFDQIIFTEVLEHLNPEATRDLFREFKRTLKPGGLLIVTTPNRLSLNKANINPFRTNEPQVDEEGHGHWKEYRIEEVTSLIEEEGMEVDSAKQVSFYSHLGRSDAEGYFPLEKLLSHKNRIRNAVKVFLMIPRMVPTLKDSLICIAKAPSA